MGISSEIIEKCKKGDRKAFKEFYLQSSGWMLGIALRYIKDRNEAMSVVNTSILSAFKALKKFDDRREEKIEAWLKTILIRKAIDYMRKEETTFKRISEVKAEDLSIQGESNIENNLGKQELLVMINSLNPATKAVFNLFAIEGYKHKEIAEILKISIGTSKWHLNDARKRLQEMILNAQKIKLNL